jgi:general secretion pathway protein D
VMIEAAITEVGLNDDLGYGVQWNFQSNGNTLGVGTASALAGGATTFTYAYTGSSIAASLKALEQRTSVKVVSAPKLLVLNNQTAALQVGDQVPISTGSATTVAVPDNQVIALGGLFRDNNQLLRNGIPILSRIPVLGGIFGSQQKVQRRTELVVLLKPHVLHTPDDGRAVTEELRAKLRTLEPFRSTGGIP